MAVPNPPPMPASTPAAARRRHGWRTLLALAGLLAAAMAALWWLTPWPKIAVQRTPMELVRYLERRLQGHPKLETVALPVLDWVRQREERPVPAALPGLGKGQQAHSLPPQVYAADGRPRPQRAGGLVLAASPLPTRPPTVVHGEEALALALAQAKAGDTVEIAPGRYRLRRPLATRFPGTAFAPVVLRAAQPGTVVLESSLTYALSISQPYWLVENLAVHGVCAPNAHDRCEHAFHVVGAAKHTVLRNNWLQDFNAPVKINGFRGQWPDEGLLQFNTLTNTGPRRTLKPVDQVDLVGASGWLILDNRVEHFIKAGGHGTSYGICVKGAGRDTLISGNLVVCTTRDMSQPGTRVGITLGCGLSGPQYCRDGRCDAEQYGGIVANNVVAHCNDFGIDLHQASASQVLHNTLVNTAGIDVRKAASSAKVAGNLLEGRIRNREAGWLETSHNLVQRRLDDWLKAPEALDLLWLAAPTTVPAAHGQDFCGQPRPAVARPGAGAESACPPPATLATPAVR